MTILKQSIFTLRAKGWEFSLSIWWFILLLVFIPLLINLAVWQLERAKQRQQSLDDIVAVQQKQPLLATDARLVTSEAKYIRIQAQGNMLWSKQFLLDNQAHNTVDGYEVLTAMLIDADRAILVSRGWIPKTPGKLPNLDIPKDIEQNPSLTGLAAVPPPRLADYQREILEKSGDFEAMISDPSLVEWPLVIQEEDFNILSNLLEVELIPRVLHPETSPFSYRQVWEIEARGPAVNYGYAAQWLGMALLLIGAALFLNTKRVKKDA